MAKAPDQASAPANTTTSTPPAAPPQVGAAPQTGAQQDQAQAGQQQTIRLDESKLVKAYANFCRVSPGFEELIIDFGLSSQPIGAPAPQSISIDQRIIVNYFMAKRLLSALAGSVQRYEQIFGPLEIDINKRVQQQGAAQAGGGAPQASPPADTEQK